MRLSTMLAAAAGALALGACGGQQDDPANPPQLGDWEISRIATSLRKNGASLAQEERTDVYLDSGISPANTSRDCTEPKLADKEWLALYISRQLDRTCTITEALQSVASGSGKSGASAQGKGICGEAERGDGRPAETSFHYYGDVTPTSFKADVEVSIRSEMAGGGSDTTGMTVKIEGTRKGECGAQGSPGTFREEAR
jgi:hypothetical protein